MKKIFNKAGQFKVYLIICCDDDADDYAHHLSI